MSSCNLRPHHGLCIRFFEGKGYSPEFADNMADVIRTLEGADIRLAAGVDAICTACPNNEAGVCLHADKVRRYDEAVLAACGLTAGQVLGWRELSELVGSSIIRAGRLREICGDCAWSAICQSKADRMANNRELP